jgi:hypothetical protein
MIVNLLTSKFNASRKEIKFARFLILMTFFNFLMSGVENEKKNGGEKRLGDRMLEK